MGFPCFRQQNAGIDGHFNAKHGIFGGGGRPKNPGGYNPSDFSGFTLQKSHVNHWGYKPLTIRGMSHQVLMMLGTPI